MTRPMLSAIPVALALFSAAGSAEGSDTYTTLSFQCSQDGVNWSNQLNLASSPLTRRVLLRTSVTWHSDELPEPIGFANVTFQPIFGGFRVADTIAPFTNAGYNGNGGSVFLDQSPLNGPFGRISPFAATGPGLGFQRYLVHEHNGTDGAPPGRYLRIARHDITRWIGMGTATIGTAAVNNFNGAGGIAIVQNSVPLQQAGDPGFKRGIRDVVIFQIAFDIAPVAPGESLDLTVDVPFLGFNRDMLHPTRPASWFVDEGNNWVHTRIEVIPAAVHVPAPSLAAIIACAGLPLMRRTRRGVRVVSSRD